MNIEIREDLKHKLRATAETLFLKYGIRSVTMSDIAKELGISKKTIYQYYQDKDSLVSAVVQAMCQQDRESIIRIDKEAKDAIEAVLTTSEYFREILSNLNPAMIYDTEKYHPKAWEIQKKFQNEFAYNMIKKNIEQGIEAGLYRPEVNPELIAMMRLAQIEILTSQEKRFLKTEIDLVKIHLEMTEHFIRGILTPKGLEKLEEYKNQL